MYTRLHSFPLVKASRFCFAVPTPKFESREGKVSFKVLSENKNYGSEERAPLMRSFISDICLMGIGKLGMSWYNFNSTLYN